MNGRLCMSYIGADTGTRRRETSVIIATSASDLVDYFSKKVALIKMQRHSREEIPLSRPVHD